MKSKTLMKSLGIVHEESTVSSDALDRYAVMFSNSLTAAQIKALAALFGWSPPADPIVLGECN
jgi:hypothetical protein